MEKRKATLGRPRVKGLSVDKASKTTTDPPEASMPWGEWENQRAFEPFSRPAQPTRERRRKSDSSREFYTHENGNIVASVGQGKERSDRGTQKSSVGQVKERLDRGAKKSSVSQAKEGLDRGAKKSNVSQAKGESDREPGKSRLYDGAEKVVSQESSVGLSRVEVRQEREDLPLSANSTGAAQVNENRVSSSSNEMREGFEIFSQAQNSPSTPPTLDDIDRWTSHIDMQRFGESLQVAVNAVFPNETKSRYKKVSVLMLSWADEDPRLPVSMEIDKLAAVLEDTYHFDVERWEIPDQNCHFKVAEKVMGFVAPVEDGREQLKIVYYAGHARLMDTRALALTSWRNKESAKCPMVKWGAIQSFLEESPSDALILLDCCASGTANTSEGSGVTEIISACAWNQIANGVGPYSLTSALVIELERLSKRAQFSVGELYRNVYLRMQSWMPEWITEEGLNVERHPAPIHLVLTQDSQMPRSIQLSVLPRTTRLLEQSARKHQPSDGARLKLNRAEPSDDYSLTSVTGSQVGFLQGNLSEKFPRLAFAVRLRESVAHNEDIEHLFVDWFRNMPAIAEEIKVEAGFDSFSTLLIVSMPLSLSAYMPRDPAIMALGPINSGNLASITASRSLQLEGEVLFELLQSASYHGDTLRKGLKQYLLTYEAYEARRDHSSMRWQREEKTIMHNLLSQLRRVSQLGIQELEDVKQLDRSRREY